MSHEPHLYDEDRRHMYTVSLDMTCVREGESLSGMVDTSLCAGRERGSVSVNEWYLVSASVCVAVCEV